MTTARHLALMALMRDIEDPSAVYRRSVRLAAALETEAPQWTTAVEKGKTALDEIEQAVHAWVAANPDNPADSAYEQRLREQLAAARSATLTEAETEIAAAIDRNRAEHPDSQPMITRRLGMRAAERVVRGLRVDAEPARVVADQSLTLQAELATVRDLLRTENARANSAIDRETTAEEYAEEQRLALSQALGLGTGAPWDAIRDRAAELHTTTQRQPDISTQECCGAEPPSVLVNSAGAEWTPGDCWCTLPPGHDGEHRCQPCADRCGAPGWSAARA